VCVRERDTVRERMFMRENDDEREKVRERKAKKYAAHLESQLTKETRE